MIRKTILLYTQMQQSIYKNVRADLENREWSLAIHLCCFISILVEKLL